MSYPEEIELAQYIVERFKQLDVKQVFGVPGKLLSFERYSMSLYITQRFNRIFKQVTLP
jgi:TPP-dependent 2-oxoacid decarboxylase